MSSIICIVRRTESTEAQPGSDHGPLCGAIDAIAAMLSRGAVHRGPARPFARRHTREDALLPAETDALHRTLYDRSRARSWSAAGICASRQLGNLPRRGLWFGGGTHSLADVLVSPDDVEPWRNRERCSSRPQSTGAIRRAQWFGSSVGSCGVNGGGDRKAVAEWVDVTDFALEAEVPVNSNPVSAGTVSWVSNPGIGTDNHRGYYVGVDSNLSLALGKADAGRWLELESADLAFTAGDWSRLKDRTARRCGRRTGSAGYVRSDRSTARAWIPRTSPAKGWRRLAIASRQGCGRIARRCWLRPPFASPWSSMCWRPVLVGAIEDGPADVVRDRLGTARHLSST